ncbi:MAG: DNA polymerase III subunit gamma/tau, partial [Alphaproteobacteria bacterium]|nr:DNA polymerase III subunit gamma/tau [Alphaproteobacteria bacterium]
ARKYRPQNFDQLIGQDALVRTLTNAIQSGRIAHAFILTGVRGVGKTTTARIIAKALNYTGADGTAGPTSGPTDDCKICQSIAEDRHPDVMEMDAASRTGVDDIREILEAVRYGPTSARYKIYIIDEVHMLSKNAFNALLKTLEEPPPHVKFIFATTEIQKVPVTVLSRCQRFDLRRVDVATLEKHFRWVCEQEQVPIEDEATAMIARAADGSVRDGLSILDQAMALSADGVTTGQVTGMLGLADHARLLDLMETILSGQINTAMTTMADLYKAGVDAQKILQDLLDLTHLLAKFQAASSSPATVEPNMAASERNRAVTMAQKTGIPALGRVWQILLKGLSEVQYAPNAQAAAEMVLIRLCFAADLPDPATLVKQVKDSGGAGNLSGGSNKGGHGNSSSFSSSPSSSLLVKGGGGSSVQALPQTSASLLTAPVANGNLSNLSEIVGLLEQNGSLVLASQVVHFVELVHLEPGRIEFKPAPQSPPKLAQDLAKRLGDLTGSRWMVSITGRSGEPTLAAQQKVMHQSELAAVKEDPVIARILAAFPDAEILSIKKI